jgi:hypothetical protein
MMFSAAISRQRAGKRRIASKKEALASNRQGFFSCRHMGEKEEAGKFV